MEQTENTTVVTAPEKSSSMGPILALLALLVIGVGVYLFYSQQKPSTTVNVNTQMRETADSANQAVDEAGEKAQDMMQKGEELVQQGEASKDAMMEKLDTDMKVVAVEAGAFYYKPNEIRVKKGEKVKIEMKSVDMMHDFVVDELGIKMPVTKSGEMGTVEFTAEKTGTFEYYCSVGEHRAKGQVGKLIVE